MERDDMEPTADAPTMSVRRVALLALPALAAIVLTLTTLAGVGAARGRIAASTSSQSLFAAGRIDLLVESGQVAATRDLLFDRDGLYAGQVLERCLQVSHHGSFDEASIRLHGTETGGDGLASFLSIAIDTGSGTDPECLDFTTESEIHRGRLDSTLARHSSFASGIRLAENAPTQHVTNIRIRLEVADDNDAQGRETRFVLTFEAQP